MTFDPDTDWTNVRFDVENQQIIIKDPKKKEVRAIDLKKKRPKHTLKCGIEEY